MKKYAGLIIVALFIGGLFTYRYFADCIDFYVIYDNENGYYDGDYYLYGNGALALSDEKIEAIKNIDGIESINPNLYLKTRSIDEDLLQESFVKAEVDGKEVYIRLPVKVQLDEKFYFDSVPVYQIGLVDYAKEKFVETEVINKNDFSISYGDNRVVRKFNGVDTGIYIDKYLYYAFGCNENTKSLKITVPIYVPVKMKKELVHYQTAVDEYGIPLESVQYDFYAETQTITEYQMIEYTFEVEGVIDELAYYIYYPIELNEHILNLVDYSRVELDEGETYYKANSYTIKFENKISINGAVRKIDQVIDRFVISHPLYSHRFEK